MALAPVRVGVEAVKRIALICLVVLTYIAVETERDLHRAFRGR